MINSQSKSLGLKDSSLMKTEANTQNSLNNTDDFDYRLKVRHVVDIYIYLYIYIYLLYGCGQHQREKCAYIKDNCTLFSMMSTATVLHHVLSPLAPH